MRKIIAAIIVLAARSSAALDLPPDLDAPALAGWEALKSEGYKRSRTCDPGAVLGSCITEILVRQDRERILLRESSAPGGIVYREICFELRLASHPQLLCQTYGPTPRS